MSIMASITMKVPVLPTPALQRHETNHDDSVDHDRPGEGWIDHLDFFEELEHADGGEGNSKVRPAGEVQLGDQPGSLSSIAGLLRRDTNAGGKKHSERD
ncbi:hypothetical protein EYF80_015917 [Liparis tanakae]|uniref:Uncharacterized protein n=1 Tax=Liparis tanakae TaxID=230148 RepID=A0A4Z2I7T3_9TELE|nr:hypothetical protein EYF80_015917 [Liparis tanakae]